MIKKIIPIFIILLTALSVSAGIVDEYKEKYDFISYDDSIFTFESEFVLPDGYQYLESDKLNEWEIWISEFPLWHAWKSVGNFGGGLFAKYDEISRAVHIPWRGPHYKEMNFPVRILAEYLKYHENQDKLVIALRRGDTLNYSQWLSGKPAFTSRSNIFIREGEKREASDEDYYQFLHFMFDYSDYLSLEKNCIEISEKELAPGDLVIGRDKSGLKGKVFFIMSVIENENGERKYAPATGCEKPCDFHIPISNSNRSNPWVTITELKSMTGEFENIFLGRFKLIKD